MEFQLVRHETMKDVFLEEEFPQCTHSTISSLLLNYITIFVYMLFYSIYYWCVVVFISHQLCL